MNGKVILIIYCILGFSTANKTWLPVNPNYEDLNLENQKNSARSNYKNYQDMLALRRLPTFIYGRYDSVAFNDDVFAFER